MGQPVLQSSFNAGEWAPALNARVDLAKYHSGAALLQNFFVDYRGGATTRPGSKLVLPVKTNGAILIPFQASFLVSYILEFGNGYVRFFNNGSPILESATNLTAAAAGPPETFTDTGHGYSNGDWLFIQNNYYIVAGATTNTFTLTDLFGNAINTNPFTLPAAPQRVYTIASPYTTADLSTTPLRLKYAQDVNFLFLCHPNHQPYLLTLITANNWTLAAISFGPTIAAPTGLITSTSISGGSVDYAYVVTSVDVDGQESSPSAFATITGAQDIRSVAGTNTITWTAVPGAISYNVYRAEPVYSAAVPSGAQFGFVGNCTGVKFNDSNITPDFTQCPPLIQNPFSGSGIQNVTITAAGNYTLVPTITVTAAPPGGVTAVVQAVLQTDNYAIHAPGTGYAVNQTFTTGQGLSGSITSVNVTGGVTGAIISVPGTVTSGIAPTTVAPTGGTGNGFQLSLAWGVTQTILANPGEGYLVAPTLTFTAGSGATATATATLGAASSGNPTVPALHQQRSFFGGPILSTSQFNLSQPGAPFNYNISAPTQPSDAIQATLTNNTLNSIKSAISVSAGLIIFTDRAAWLLNGGSAGSAIDATAFVANPQAYSGASDLPPILTPNDILYVQSKNSIVRDLAFNFYLNNYVGTDITILSSHLFYGFQLLQWAWAEEPFKLAWAVRNDGVLLSLTFEKDQELVAWSHHTTAGSYTSVTAVGETTSIGNLDAVYCIVQRSINGQTVQYIERFVELTYPLDYISSWQVDAGIGYSGAPATTFTGANHLSGQPCTGVADGVVINFTMPVGGTFVFGPGGTAGLTGIASASVVTVGLPIPTPTIQTLALDLGEPTVQGKRKKVAAVTARVASALGLSAGKTLATVQPMKDLIIGNIGTMSNAPITGLQTTDARMIMDPDWDVFGQYFITQPNPYPATVLGLIPEIEVGDRS